MGTTSKEQTYRSVGRRDLHLIPPEELTVVDDPEHPLYDDRIHLPLDEDLVKNIMTCGVKKPIIVRINGKNKKGDNVIEVVDGRRRTLHTLEANKRLKKMGEEPIAVPCVSEKGGKDEDVIETMLVTNEFNKKPSPMNRAEKLKRLLDRGTPKSRCAVILGVSEATVTNYERLLECSKEVQQAVDTGRIPLDATKKLWKLSRDEQKAAIKQIEEAGLKGREVVRHADNLVNGKPSSPENVATERLRSRAAIERARYSVLPGPKDEQDDTMDLVAAILGWTLGSEDALDHYPELKSRLDEALQKKPRAPKEAKVKAEKSNDKPRGKKTKKRQRVVETVDL